MVIWRIIEEVYDLNKRDGFVFLFKILIYADKIEPELFDDDICCGDGGIYSGKIFFWNNNGGDCWTLLTFYLVEIRECLFLRGLES